MDMVDPLRVVGESERGNGGHLHRPLFGLVLSIADQERDNGRRRSASLSWSGTRPESGPRRRGVWGRPLRWTPLVWTSPPDIRLHVSHPASGATASTTVDVQRALHGPEDLLLEGISVLRTEVAEEEKSSSCAGETPGHRLATGGVHLCTS
ncbi:MAG: hypothetical protein CM15mP128_2280 [Methanobacteriota archaeon]|nr:MAG: hypothetical protein CM15mP128_2280 [Euryarchaeota archaeon]